MIFTKELPKKSGWFWAVRKDYRTNPQIVVIGDPSKKRRRVNIKGESRYVRNIYGEEIYNDTCIDNDYLYGDEIHVPNIFFFDD